jgi:hypothetical protein
LKRLISSVNFVFSKIDQDSEVRNLWHREIFTFLVDREKMGPRLGNMKEILQKALLCGIPWSHVCQSFAREFILRSVRRYKMREGATPLDYYRHLENQILGECKAFLFMIAFNANQMENDTIQTIRKVGSLRDAFLLLGVVPLQQRNIFVEKEIIKLITWALKQPDAPKVHEEVALVPYSGKQLADFRDDKKLSIAQVPIREFWKTRELALSNEMNALIASHQSNSVKFPPKESFKSNVCYFCQESFPDRQTLFRTHLEPIFAARDRRHVNLRDPTDPLFGKLSNHQNHSPGELRFVIGEENGKISFKCSVQGCHAAFKTEKELNRHQKDNGLSFDWSQVEVEQEEKNLADAHADAKEVAGNDDLSECVVCFENTVNAMVIPCGHQYFCMDCIISVKASAGGCPYCRQVIRDIIEINL